MERGGVVRHHRARDGAQDVVEVSGRLVQRELVVSLRARPVEVDLPPLAPQPPFGHDLMRVDLEGDPVPLGQAAELVVREPRRPMVDGQDGVARVIVHGSPSHLSQSSLQNELRDR